METAKTTKDPVVDVQPRAILFHEILHNKKPIFDIYGLNSDTLHIKIFTNGKVTGIGRVGVFNKFGDFIHHYNDIARRLFQESSFIDEEL